MSDNYSHEQHTIPVTVDKSHLITIGEKLYTEKMSFLRELVNNAFDADATRVDVVIAPDAIIITDNGSGMDENGLCQYFTIGSPHKKHADISPRHGRARIGEFGIGKFAALAACKKFEVETQCGVFHARLIFDKETWAQHDDWHLNIDILPPISEHGDGCAITLRSPSITIVPGKVRRYLAEKSPIHAPNFSIYCNDELVTGDVVTGRHLSISLETLFGPIAGSLIITPIERRDRPLGIAITVKGVLIRYEPLGLDTYRKLGVTRLTGRVNADWLPITSGRDDFIRDSAEFITFTEAIRKEISKALAQIKHDGDTTANRQASRVLKDALQRIGKAMKARKELFPGAQVPMGTVAGANDAPQVAGYNVSEATFIPSDEELPPEVKGRFAQGANKKRLRGRHHAMLGDKSVLRTLRIANLEIAVRLEHLGVDEESILSGGIIFINLDHPLYRANQRDDSLLAAHLARVITKELALQTGITDPRQIFSLQTELLTSALANERKSSKK
ncbi:MAG: hypothetical protein UT67_C0005G0006 [Candidatus Magasanikbacteria bacterium GW2011_GWA2_40_10]|uniref:ATP-binding protein n=1 Tax=Candidatus Magasanikbacteria bacterium GW2011_GWA2_40_10 TaxID=1619037 RepID=A0A0G0Q3C7_9BACT|nr:MAG: hypothetical protein UT67_C0005G0006 [Candidatus Magasanikbacteria bacterium GW2011_GWA2_40_10]